MIGLQIGSFPICKQCLCGQFLQILLLLTVSSQQSMIDKISRLPNNTGKEIKTHEGQGGNETKLLFMADVEAIFLIFLLFLSLTALRCN